MAVLLAVLLICGIVDVALGYTAGAPPTTCQGMVPGHSGIPAANSLPPFAYKFTQSTYQAGESITGHIEADDVAMKGFLIQARDMSHNIVGQFSSVTGGVPINCNSQGSDAVTHTNGSPKFKVTFVWSAPATNVGAINFVATIVQNYGTFWTNVQSIPLTYTEPAVPTLPPTQPPTEPPTDPPTEPPTDPPTEPPIEPPTEVPTEPPTQPPTEPPTQPPPTTVPDIGTVDPSVPTWPKTPAPPTVPTTPTEEPVIPEAGTLVMSDECGITKGCFVQCEGERCDYVITWKDIGDSVAFDVSATLARDGDKWIAIAFSYDLHMGTDDVIDCVSEGDKISVRRSYNKGKSNIHFDENEGIIGLSNRQGSFKDGIFNCKFTRTKQPTVSRKKRQTSKPSMFDLESDWHLMFGYGAAAPGFHKMMHVENPVVTAKKVDFQSTAVIGDVATYPLIKVHAILMVIAWIFCTGVGIVSARYYKPVWSSRLLYGQKVWFQIHRSCMVTALVLTVVGFIIIFVEAKGYSKVPSIEGQEYLQAHPPLGIIVTALCIINPIMSIFRPGPKDPNRPIFNWSHWAVGMLAHILSVITICFGMQMKKSKAPKYSVWVVVGYIVYHLVMEMILKSLDLFADRQDSGHVESLAMTQVNGGSYQNGNGYKASPPPAYSDKEDTKDPKDNIIKKLLLGFHAVLALAFTITLVLLVAMY